jgi:hypothetical protein
LLFPIIPMTTSTVFWIFLGIKRHTLFLGNPLTHANGNLVSKQSFIAIILSVTFFPTNILAQETDKKLDIGKGTGKDTVFVISNPANVDTTISVTKEIKPEKKDTVSVVQKRHSPAKAALLSTALPGLGQAYNKKYWKIPIVYAGFAGLGYWIGRNVKNYRTYRDAYQFRMDDDSLTIDPFVEQYGNADLKTLKDFYKRNLDLSIILTAVWYALNIVDAAVDAHLFEFDVSDNLSMRVQPVLEYQSRNNNFTGLKVQFAMKSTKHESRWLSGRIYETRGIVINKL